MQVSLSKIINSSTFECSLGSFSAQLIGAKSYNVGDFFELDTTEVFERDLNLFQSVDEPGIIWDGERNWLTGILENILDRDTAILRIHDSQLLFEYSGSLVGFKDLPVSLMAMRLQLFPIEY
ncbi:hypothetical protein XMM379_001815 [Aliiroseovarius sp. xm-m-379]|uniref:hypothetical protein n=1 Tax=unclassified Aliiroseovarius TaxID=2623558 RepID=UPI001567E2EB|nr:MULTISPECIES: hypothetical protein [unclassified Aliiroseovarius]NRP25123.1 hypothetical protein [Aliiroseovarius sp. xm-m-379]NRP31384.1 hypothetical protein [Aliiroseovarius sp. xm-m-314]NRP33922.1 hypothetical protein [Aliiroseovarius sp. xm-a-104]NRP45382.1 hypothetical protein [Aliiroseovarius sp. xm-m-378]NRP50646.1 hypothetical protein [Aliiroseovarius sp. xm-m-354]